MDATWTDEEKVREYVGRVGRLAARAVGEAELVEHLPARVDRALDLRWRGFALLVGRVPD